MKNVLFFAAVVLFCTQVLEAIPSNSVKSCTTCGNGGGTKVVTTRTTQTIPSSSTITYSVNSGNNLAHNANTGNIGNGANFGYFGNGGTVTKISSSSDYDAITEKLRNLSGNSGQTSIVTKTSSSTVSESNAEKLKHLFGNTEVDGSTVTSWSSSGKGENNGHSGNSDNQFNVAWNFENKNVGGNCNHDKGKGNEEGPREKCKNDLMDAYAEIALLKMKVLNLQNENNELRNDKTKQQNEIQSWKIQFEQISFTLKQENIQLNLVIQENKNLIVTLNTRIQQMTTIIQINEKQLGELKLKNEALRLESESWKKNSEELTRSNNELKKTVKEITVKFNTCENNNSQISIKIVSIEQSLKNIRVSLSTCEHEKQKVEQALAVKINELTEDDKKDYQELMLRKAVEADLARCRAQLVIIETNFKTEQASSLECRNQITIIQSEKTTIINKYENRISSLQISIDTCNESLRSEIASNNLLNIANQNNELEVKHITNELTVLKQTNLQLELKIQNYSGNAEKLGKELSNCRNEFASLKITIEQNTSALADCLSNLDSNKNLLIISETKINQQENEINLLAADKQRCEEDLQELRCGTNKWAWTVNDSNDRQKEIVNDIFGDLDTISSLVEDFTDNNDFPCNAE